MSVEDIRNYIKKRLMEGVPPPYYGEGGLAGEVAKKFDIKVSSAGYRVWEVLKQLKKEKIEQEPLQSRLLSPEEVSEDEELREEELTRGGFTLEEELERQMASNINRLEKGLTLKQRQYKTEFGVVDILAEDASGRKVVVELKAGLCDERALMQLLRYMAAIKKSNPDEEVRGILVAHDFSDETKLIASQLPQVKLKSYSVYFEISEPV